MSDALRIHAGDHPVLARSLRAKLLKTAAEYSQQVGDGCALDWPDYKHRIGVIRGLREAAEICQAEESNLNGER